MNNIVKGCVACVIVTYNRLQLLKNAVSALRIQSIEGIDIIVVNNGSTDGTKEWLNTQTDLIIVNQDNLGGAGGFYTGMKKAFESGYKWIWLQDDDGVAAPTQIERLIDGAMRVDSKFVNALVCDIDNPENLSFGLYYKGICISKSSVAKQYGELYNAICPFNGTLLHRDLISDIGFVKREMFIWGDEVEYTNRARKAGYKLYTITDAIHFHPVNKTPAVNAIPFINLFQIIVPPVKRRKLFFRNKGYNSRYASNRGRFLEYTLYFLYFLLRFKFQELYNFVLFYRKGAINDYSDII